MVVAGEAGAVGATTAAILAAILAHVSAAQSHVVTHVIMDVAATKLKAGSEIEEAKAIGLCLFG